MHIGKSGKRLMVNFLSLILIKGFGFLTPLLVLPYMTRVVGVANWGIIAFASAVMVFFETFTDWGFNFTGTRDLAKVREDRYKASIIYSQIFFSRIVMMIMSFIILLALTLILPEFGQNQTILLFTFLYIPGNILCNDWAFQAFEQMKYLTITNITSRLVLLSLVFVVVNSKVDYIYYPLLIAAGSIVSGLLAQILIKKKLGLQLIPQSYKDIYKRIKGSTNMFITLFLPNLYTNFTTVLLKSSRGNTEAGIYAGGTQVNNLLDNFISILSRTFFPFLTRHQDKHYIYVMISGTLSVIASLVAFFGADFFVGFFLSDEFADAVTVMRIMAISPIFLFLMNTYGTNYLVVVGKERILRNIIIVCSIIGFALTWPLTTQYGYIGAAITVTSIWGIRGVTTYIYAKREMKLNQK